ncbi:unnamed protein product [Rhizophagus irregularis]|nr:unnamed protein product [Rhizophagus irregularis]
MKTSNRNWTSRSKRILRLREDNERKLLRTFLNFSAQSRAHILSKSIEVEQPGQPEPKFGLNGREKEKISIGHLKIMMFDSNWITNVSLRISRENTN